MPRHGYPHLTTCLLGGPTSRLEELEEEDEQLPTAFSEDALAAEWVKRHGDNWRYIAQWGQWYNWQGDVWQKDERQQPFELARTVCRDAQAWPGCADLKKSDLLRLSSARTANAALQFVKSDRTVAAIPDQWDQQLMYLGVPGGVIDLVTGQMVEPDKLQYITKRTAVAPKHGIPTQWLTFLERVCDYDKSLVSYLQRFAGYCLTGDTSEHAFAFLYGTGANGKTTFVQTLLGIMGEYSMTASMETFSESHSERHSTEIARLRGARLVITEETSTGSRWNEGRIKRLTGGGRIAARFMRQDDFEFEPRFKLLIAGNHKPSLRADEAMKRRVHLIPFIVTIPEAERDRELGDKLKSEWPQIFAWMLDGCAEWRRIGLSATARIKEASAAYIESNDTLGAWLEDRTEPMANGEITDGKMLYNDFARWCEEQGETVWKRRGWSDAMIDRGLKDARKRINGTLTRGFHGVKLRLASASQQQASDYSKEYDK